MREWTDWGRLLREALDQERLLCGSQAGHWPEVRAVHLRSQHRSIPLVVGLNALFVLLTAGVFRDAAGWPFLCAWVVLNGLWCLHVLRAWARLRRRDYQRARPWAMRRAQMGTAALSLLWSAAVLAWFGHADEVGRNFMVTVVVGAMCVGSLGLSALASAAWCYLLPLTLATAATLALYPGAYVAYELPALGLYALALAWFTLHISRIITTHVLAERRLRSSLHELELTRMHLQRSEQLASLGTLLAGVSHEVNTPLGVAVTACSCVQETLGELRQSSGGQPHAQALLEQAIEGVDMLQNNLARAASLVRGFKQTLVSQVDERMCEFDAVEIARALLANLHPVLCRVPVTPLLSGVSSLRVRSSPGALNQVLTNLLINSAQHAFEGVAKPCIDIEFSEHPGGWLLRYSDNGVGIPPALESRIFEPFFTTRRGRGGTGLGLSIVHNLVTQQLGGELRVSSGEGGGLAFVLELPSEAPDWLEGTRGSGLPRDRLD